MALFSVEDLSEKELETIVEWDVRTWGPVLEFWLETLRNLGGVEERLVLEVGARNGGVSYFFAEHLGCRVCCSDLGGPTDRAQQLHEPLITAGRLTHHDADARHLPWADESFDVVVFKSVMGGVFGAAGPHGGELAISEMHRVLRPGGILLFAENLSGSWLHDQARKRFVPWGKDWHYLTYEELGRLMAGFAEYEMRTTGFLSAFAPQRAKRAIGAVDELVTRCVPERYRYVGYGYARKETMS